MTICRSSAALLGAALLWGAVAAPAPAQQAQAPSPAPVPQQPAALPSGPPPATHVVGPGETLWSLAQQYLGDALLWPEIYRLNTAVIEDPHWIFPGEELRLVPGEETPAPADAVVTVAPSGDTVRQTPVARPAAAPTIFAQAAIAPATTQQAVELRNERAYRAVREGEYYAAGFVTEEQPLPSGRLLGNVQTAAIRRLTASATATLFGAVALRPPPGDTLQRGDRLLAYRRGVAIRGYGDVIVPTGLLRVTSPGDARSNAVATVVALYGQMTDGQEFIRVAPFSFATNARAEDVADGVTGEVVGLRDAREVAAMQDVLFINRGAEDGVHLGDVFTISSVASGGGDMGAVERDHGRALIVNTRPHTSSAVIIELYRSDIRPGAAVRQIRRMPG